MLWERSIRRKGYYGVIFAERRRLIHSYVLSTRRVQPEDQNRDTLLATDSKDNGNAALSAASITRLKTAHAGLKGYSLLLFFYFEQETEVKAGCERATHPA